MISDFERRHIIFNGYVVDYRLLCSMTSKGVLVIHLISYLMRNGKKEAIKLYHFLGMMQLSKTFVAFVIKV